MVVDEVAGVAIDEAVGAAETTAEEEAGGEHPNSAALAPDPLVEEEGTLPGSEEEASGGAVAGAPVARSIDHLQPYVA